MAMQLLILNANAQIGNSNNGSFIDTYIPSVSAGITGICVRMYKPSTARYQQCGAPVAICLAGGDASDQISSADYSSVDLSSHGIIKILFNYPGGGSSTKKSGGTYDNRGENCIQATYDVLKFATGLLNDKNGKSISQLLGSSIIPDTQNAGMIGNSNGGNMAFVVAGRFAQYLPGLKWIANWESPVGDGHYCADKGNILDGDNDAYTPGSDSIGGTFDWTKLKYSSTVKPSSSSFSSITGGLYFDNNNDNKYTSSSTDYVPKGWEANLGTSITKIYYTEEVINNGSSLIPSTNIKLASATDVKSFWSIRNGYYYIDEILNTRPDLFFILMASTVDHIQVAIDRPHLVAQYSPLQSGGLKFVRLNPDKAYVTSIKGSYFSNISDNNAFEFYDYTSIQASNVLQNESVDYDTFVIATAAELCDRVFNNDISANLTSVLSTQCVSIISSLENIDSRNTEQITLFPNPLRSGEQLHLNIHGSISEEEVLIILYDVYGRKIQESKYYSNDILFSTDNFSKGTYLLSILHDKIVTNKLIIILNSTG
jgi:hypothetical protein